jgi:hypothetical protein
MKTLVTNIGTLVSGNIRAPLLAADSRVIQDGRVAMTPGRSTRGTRSARGRLATFPALRRC